MKRLAQTSALIVVLLACIPASIGAATSDLSCNAGGALTGFPGKDNGEEIKNYQPGSFERLVGATKFALQIKDTPDFLITDREITVVDRDGNEVMRTVPEFFPNPDEKLRKYSLEIAFSNAVVKPADLKTLYTAAKAASSSLDLSDHHVKSGYWTYFSRTRSQDVLDRLISGFKLTVSVSERPTLDPAGTFSEGLVTRLREIDEHEESFALEFDPTLLFRTSADYSAAAAALDAYAKTYKPGALGLNNPTAEGIRGAERFLVAALPKFKVEIVDQYDLLEYGGRFLRSALQEDSIEVYTLTWDLNRFIRSRSDELTDLGTNATLAKLGKTAPQVLTPPQIVIEDAQPVYWRLTATGGVTPVTFTLTSSGCNGNNVDSGVVGVGLTLESSGVVGGYPTGLSNPAGGAGPPSQCTFKIEARDAIGQGSELDCSIVP